MGSPSFFSLLFCFYIFARPHISNCRTYEIYVTCVIDPEGRPRGHWFQTTPFDPHFYTHSTLDPRPRSTTRSTRELCDYGPDREEGFLYKLWKVGCFQIAQPIKTHIAARPPGAAAAGRCGGFFIFFIFVFKKNIFSIWKFTVIYPGRPAAGRPGPGRPAAGQQGNF